MMDNFIEHSLPAGRKSFSIPVHPSSSMYGAGSMPSAFLGRTRPVSSGPGGERSSDSVAHRPTILANPSAVTIAFRELQERAKILEAERDGAADEGVKLQAKIDEISGGREDRYAARNAARLKATEELFHVREEGNRVRVAMGEMDTTLVYLDNDFRAIQMNLTSDRGTFSVVEDDCVEMRGKLLELVSRRDLLDKEVHHMNNSIEESQKKMGSVPSRHKTQSSRLRSTVQKTEEQIKVLQHQTEQQQIQMATVKKYLDMLLDVNDEICDTVMARELARTRTLRLSGRVNLPPNSPDRDVDIAAALSPSGKRNSSSPKMMGDRSALADGLAPSLKRGSSANSPTSATKAIADLIHRAQDIALSKDQYIVKSDFAASGGYVNNSSLSGNGEDNEEDNEDGRGKGRRKTTKKSRKMSRFVPLNDVMKVINADAVRHALRSQKERAMNDARDLLEVTSGLGIGSQGGGGSGTTTPASRTPLSGSPARSLATKPKPQTAMAKRRKREAAATRTKKESVRRGNEFYHHHKYGYDSVASAAEAYHSHAAQRRPLSAPMLGLGARASTLQAAPGGGANSGSGDKRRFWGPAGKGGQVVSENVLINRDKVAAARRRHWVDAEFNHFNKLHSPEKLKNRR